MADGIRLGHHGGDSGIVDREAKKEEAIQDVVLPDPTRSLGLMLGVSGAASHKQLKRLSHVLTTADGFFRLHRHWLVARSLSPHYQHTVRRLFSHSPLVLTSAYQCVLDLLGARSLKFEGSEPPDLARGASCLRELVRSPGSLKSVEDAALVLMLGQILFIYNVLIAWPCTHIIVRNTLLTARDWYPAMLQAAEWDPATLASVFVDTVQCLVRRDVPVLRLRLPVRDRFMVDRLLGISSSLLPLLYDLCACSHRVKTHAPAPTPSSPVDDDDDDAYSAVERQIRSWKPVLPPECKHSSAETSSLLAQAHMYKTAGLVLIHRLRHPLGIADEIGKRYAQSILQDLSTFSWRIGSQDASGIGSNFLLLLVTLELPEKGNALVKALEPFRFGPKQYIQILDFADYVRMQRSGGFHGLWFDLVEGRLGVTLP